MNNIVNTLQRFIRNKNTVTIVGVIIIIAILYFSYNAQIENQVRPVRGIPVANQTIQPRTLITEDMIDYIDVAPIVLSNDVLLSVYDVVGKYTNYNTVVPKGSMFYNEVLVTKDELPDSAFEKIKEGEVVVKLPVNMDTTYGNSIFPGNKIDIYMKAETVEGQIMVGKLIENVEVIAVKDASGKHVFENTSEQRTPSILIFGLKPELNILLLKAMYLKARSVEVFPVPHGGTVVQPGETQISSQNLKDFINAHTVPNDELIEEETSPDETLPEDNLDENPIVEEGE